MLNDRVVSRSIWWASPCLPQVTPHPKQMSLTRLQGLRWRRGHRCWVSLGSPPFGRDLCTISRDRRLSTTWLHARRFHEPTLRQLQRCWQGAEYACPLWQLEVEYRMCNDPFRFMLYTAPNSHIANLSTIQSTQSPHRSLPNYPKPPAPPTPSNSPTTTLPPPPRPPHHQTHPNASAQPTSAKAPPQKATSTPPSTSPPRSPPPASSCAETTASQSRPQHSNNIVATASPHGASATGSTPSAWTGMTSSPCARSFAAPARWRWRRAANPCWWSV